MRTSRMRSQSATCRNHGFRGQSWALCLLFQLLFGGNTTVLAQSIKTEPSGSVGAQSDWPHWRGPQANGVATAKRPPLAWGVDRNIRWKTAIAGEGSATPIIWQDQVFLASAIPTNRSAGETVVHPDARTQPPKVVYQFAVTCLERSTGKLSWQRVVTEQAPREGRHATNTYASGSPTTDGKRLYVSFGSHGLFCLAMDGSLVWSKQLGQMRTRRGWGEAVTPVVYDDSLIVNWDQEDDSFIVAFEAATGAERWRQARDENTSWNTPVVVPHQGTTQVIVNGTNRVRSYDLRTGRLIWQCGGQTVNAIPSPVVAGDHVICMSGYRGSAAFSIPLDSTGDVTDSETLLWSHHQSTPYVPSPIVYQGQLYFTRANVGIVSCLDVATGEVIFGPLRLAGIDNIYASPVAAANRIYLTGRDGTTVVLKHGRQLEILAVNRLDEPIDASPAVVDHQVFLRGLKHVYCIQNDSGQLPHEITDER